MDIQDDPQRQTERRPRDRRSARSRFQALLDSAPDAMLIVDTAGTIVQLNRQAAGLFGYTEAELLGQPVELLVPEALREAHVRHRSDFMAEPRLRPMGSGLELRGRRKDGSEVPIEISLSPVEDESGLRMIGAIRDVTERRRMEEVLRDNNIELQRALLAKDRFLSNMGHELRTPLNAIIGFSGTLLMRLPGPINADQQHQLQIVRDSAQHLLDLINDLLDLANIDSGRVVLRMEPVDCAGLLGEVETKLRHMAERKQLHLALDVLHPCQAMTDRRALRQIVYNLLDNAIKFTERGEVRMQLRPTTRDGRTWVEIGVSDTGIGIAPDQHDRIFQAFQDMDSTMRTGGGLGLHLSRKFAHLLGGRIEMQSQHGSGSRFVVQIPGE